MTSNFNGSEGEGRTKERNQNPGSDVKKQSTKNVMTKAERRELQVGDIACVH